MGATVSVDIAELITKLRGMSNGGKQAARNVIASTADLIVADAKQNAPADLGTIRQQITREVVSNDELVQATIYANAPESPFQEFGTGGKVNVPEEMSDVASQFIGYKGGDMAAFIKALVDWIKRHGINRVYSVKTHKISKAKTAKLSSQLGYGSVDEMDTQTAWAIAKTILRDGLRPQPFLYPAWLKFSSQLKDKLQAELTRLANEQSE